MPKDPEDFRGYRVIEFFVLVDKKNEKLQLKKMFELVDEPRLFWHKSNSNDPDRNVWPIFSFSLGFRPPAFVDQGLIDKPGICTGTNNRVNSAPLGVEPITKLFAGVENMTDDGVKKPDTRVSKGTPL